MDASENLSSSPQSELLEQLASRQIDRLEQQRAGAPDANGHCEQVSVTGDWWCRPQGFLRSAPATPAAGEIVDVHGFLVPSELAAGYTGYSSAAGSMLQAMSSKWADWLQQIRPGTFSEPDAAAVEMVRRGIPTAYRAQVRLSAMGAHGRRQVWLVASGARMMQAANPTLFKELVEAVERDDGTAISSEVRDQIAKDLPRTLPSNLHYHRHNLESHAAMRRVLMAYAMHNMLVGYCQGMNVLCGVLLLLMSEEEAFFMLKTIVERILPAYFGQGLTGLMNDQTLIESILEDRAPDLTEHLVHVVTTRWLLCLFITAMPSEGALRIWDCVLLEGRKALFRTIVALFELLKAKLLLCPDCDTAFELIRTVRPARIGAHIIAWQVTARMWDASPLINMMNDTAPAGLFSRKPIGLYLTDERIQQIRATIKQEEIEHEQQIKQPAGARSILASVKNWTNKQVARFQRMKKSANWLDDICKLLQDNGLALSHNPRGLAQALMYADNTCAIADASLRDIVLNELLVGETKALIGLWHQLMKYLCLRLQDKDSHIQLQRALAPHTDNPLELFFVNATSCKWRPAYWLAFDHGAKQLLFVIRPAFIGMQLSDYIAPAVPFLDGFAHAGMVAGARWFAAHAFGLMKRGLQQHPDYTVLVASHALGAGVALLATMLMQAEQPEIPACFLGFSTPACVSEELAVNAQAYVSSIVLEHDIIPTLCLRRLADLASQLKPGALILSADEEQKTTSSMTEAMLQPHLFCGSKAILLRRLRGKEGENLGYSPKQVDHHEYPSDGIELSPSMFTNHGLPSYATTIHLMHQHFQLGNEFTT